MDRTPGSRQWKKIIVEFSARVARLRAFRSAGRNRWAGELGRLCQLPSQGMKKPKEHRYYLLPGMGASNRRWHRKIRRWTFVVGLLISAVLAYIIYLMNR